MRDIEHICSKTYYNLNYHFHVVVLRKYRSKVRNYHNHFLSNRTYRKQCTVNCLHNMLCASIWLKFTLFNICMHSRFAYSYAILSYIKCNCMRWKRISLRNGFAAKYGQWYYSATSWCAKSETQWPTRFVYCSENADHR